MNTGVMAIRNSRWSQQLLDAIWAFGNKKKWARKSWVCNDSPLCWQEQWALKSLQADSKIPASVCGGLRQLQHRNQRRFNSYTKAGSTKHPRARFRHGDFLVHLAGCRDDASRDCESEWRRMTRLSRRLARTEAIVAPAEHAGEGKVVLISGVRGGLPAARRSLACLTGCDARGCRVKRWWKAGRVSEARVEEGKMMGELDATMGRLDTGSQEEEEEEEEVVVITKR